MRARASRVRIIVCLFSNHPAVTLSDWFGSRRVFCAVSLSKNDIFPTMYRLKRYIIRLGLSKWLTSRQGLSLPPKHQQGCRGKTPTVPAVQCICTAARKKKEREFCIFNFFLYFCFVVLLIILIGRY